MKLDLNNTTIFCPCCKSDDINAELESYEGDVRMNCYCNYCKSTFYKTYTEQRTVVQEDRSGATLMRNDIGHLMTDLINKQSDSLIPRVKFLLETLIDTLDNADSREYEKHFQETEFAKEN